MRYVKTTSQIIETVLRGAHTYWEYADDYELVDISGRQFLKNMTGIAARHSWTMC